MDINRKTIINTQANANIVESWSSNNKGAKFNSTNNKSFIIDNQLHADSNVFDVVNNYRGYLSSYAVTGTGPKKASEGNEKIIYGQIISPSLFNPYFGVPVSGMSANTPLLDTEKYGEGNFTASKPSELTDDKSPKTLNYTLNNSGIDPSDCSIENLVNLSKKPHSPLGQARYRYIDFMYCKEVGQMSNNHLITLRKFAAPIRDNIYELATYEGNNMTQAGDVGRLITWFGTEDNKLEDILHFSYNASWKELEAKIQEENSQEMDSSRGFLGGLANLTNPNYLGMVAKGAINGGAMHQLFGDDANSAWSTTAPYENNDVVQGKRYDNNKVYEPKDTIRSTYTYEGKLTFEQEFNITFNYKLRGYDNINSKSAFLDLLTNILVVTYRKGTFWGGEQRIIGVPPNKAGWDKAQTFSKDFLGAGETFIGDLLTGRKGIGDAGSNLLGSIQNAFGNLLGIGNVNSFKDLVSGVKEKLVSLGKGGGIDAIKGILTNQMGRPAVYAFDSLLTNDAVGLWHLTIGNPLNPIISVGNLILTNAEITQSGPLGLDDFPTDIKVTVTLKHAMPRDAVDIMRMYTRGEKGTYTHIGFSKDAYKSDTVDTSTVTKDSSTKVDVIVNGKKTQQNATVIIPVREQQSSEYTGYWGDFSKERISGNRDALG